MQLESKYNLGDLITSGIRHGLGIIMEISNRSIELSPVWYYFIKFSDGSSFWIHETELTLQAEAKNNG